MIVFFLFLINQFISNYTITILYTFLTLLIILFSIIFSNKLSQLFGFFMLIISFSILLYKQADRKSTRLNSSHVSISYAVFCLKKKKINNEEDQHEQVLMDV